MSTPIHPCTIRNILYTRQRQIANMADAPSSSELDPKFVELFNKAEANIKATGLGQDKWYILVISIVAASPDPETASQLYLHLCSQPQYATSEARQALVRRLREALIKASCIVGVPKPIEAILAIAAVERPEDREYGTSRENWQCDDASLSRGIEWFKKVYTRNATDTVGLFDAHKDFAWISTHISYGLLLSDRQVLDDVDTQLVVFPGLMAQNLPTETWWHIRGTRRIGVSKEDMQVLWDTVRRVMEHFGMRSNKIPTVDEVEHDV